MKIIQNILTKLTPMILVGSIIFSSCETPIDIDYIDFEPYAVVSVHGNTDTMVNMRLTYSRWFLSEQEFTVINNANANLLVNGTESISGFYNSADKRYYFDSYIPQSGDKLDLSVNIPDHEQITASCIVPHKPEISSFSFDTTYQYNTISQIEFVLHDNHSEDNFYMLELFYLYEDYYDSTTISMEPIYFSIDDVTLVDPMDLESMIEGDYSVYTRRFVFTDSKINGENHKIKMDINDYYWPNGGILKISALTEDEYLYLVSRERAYNNNDFFAEPVQVHTNISNGIGIFSVANTLYQSFDPNYYQ